MPPIVLTEEQRAEALKKGNADLKFLLERNEVPPEMAAQWFHAGVTTMEKFANIAKDVGDLVTVLKDYLGVDQEASLEERVQVAAVTCAWTNARTRTLRAAEVEAELDTKEWRKPIATTEWLAMRTGLEKVVGTLDKRLTPAKEYVEKKLQEVEAGDYRAEEMTEVVSRPRQPCPAVGRERQHNREEGVDARERPGEPRGVEAASDGDEERLPDGRTQAYKPA